MLHGHEPASRFRGPTGVKDDGFGGGDCRGDVFAGAGSGGESGVLVEGGEGELRRGVGGRGEKYARLKIEHNKMGGLDF